MAEQSFKIYKDTAERLDKNESDIGLLKEDIVTYLQKTASNETKAYDATDLFTLKGFLNKKGEFVSNAVSLCTDYIDAKKRRSLLSLYFAR